MKRIIPFIFALALAGCVNGQVITSVTNPANSTNLYQAEIVFDGALKTFNELKGLCANRVLPPACRSYVKTAQTYIVKAYGADMAARNFIKNNPTLDATNVIQAFTGIVQNFNATVTGLSAIK